MARVVIMQPYVPAYRVPLFEALSEQLQAEGHELVIASGVPTGSQADRQDEAVLENVAQVQLRIRTIRFGPARFRVVRGRQVWRTADVVIAELAAGASATYGALLQRRRPVGVWGHVDAFVAADRPLKRRLRRWQVRHADHVLAYTERGSALALLWGASPRRVTTLQNTTETRTLIEAVERYRGRSEDAVRHELGLGDGPVFAIIGGLDASKRVDLVVATLDRLWSERPDVQFIVGGRGALERELYPARNRGQVRLLGYADTETKGKVARVATALLNPGRVGLLAVESMAMALPILTTTAAHHGPEFDYLSPGSDVLVCDPTGASMARAILQLADNPAHVAALASALRTKASTFSFDEMVRRYMTAVRALVVDTKTTTRRLKM